MNSKSEVEQKTYDLFKVLITDDKHIYMSYTDNLLIALENTKDIDVAIKEILGCVTEGLENIKYTIEKKKEVQKND